MKYKRLILLLAIAGLFIIPFCEPDKKMLVETGDASNISTTTADISGTVIDVGEGATQHGHCYGTASGTVVSGNKTSLGIAVKGDFTSSLTGLEPSTKYYVRAYTSLGGEAAYGSEITFTTASAALPELTTIAITSITKTSAVSGGNITSEGGTPVTARGVCWNVASGPTVALTTKTTDGSGEGNFASSITGLSANTVYYVRAYATNAGGTQYGDEISFTTSPEVAVAPTVKTAEVTLVTSNSAVCGGEVTNEGGAPVTGKGVCWSTVANPTITSSKTTDGTGSGSFVSNLSNLNPGTTYYVRAYATNSAGTSYGEENSFKTDAVIPALTTIAITSITSTTATSGGNITSDGGSAVTVRGVCWSTSASPTTDDSKTTDGFGAGLYSSNLTGLTGNTTYYVRAYATNSAGTAYGNELSFKTGAVVPTLITSDVTSITSTTATSGGNISSDGGSSVTAKGVCWGTSANPTTADSETSDGTGTDPFTSSITGLTPGTTYHVRAYATNSVGTGYGEDITFTIGAVIPAVSTTAISAITSTTVSSGGNVTSDGGASVTARGVCWSTADNPTTADSKTSDGTGTGSFISSITGLTPGGNYHVRAYATNSAGTAYGEDLTFTAGAALATVTTTAISDITSSTASSGGNVTNDGGSSVTARGVCWSTSANPTTSNSKTTNGTGTGSFTSSITGLNPGTTYHVRAYATNSVGTDYGEDITFTTGAVVPTVTTTAISAITSTTASSGGNITSEGGAAISVRGVCWSITANPTTADSKTSDGTGTGSFTSSITGLTPGGTYHVRAYAINSEGTAYGNDLTFTAGAVLATITTTTVSDITSTSATSGGNVTSDGGSAVTARGVCWSTSANPTTANSKTTNGTGSGSFTSSITGLTPNTTYYVRAYATNSAGTGYGDDLQFNTLCTAPSAVTNAASGIGSTTATLNGTVNANGFSAIVTFEFGLTTDYGSTITATQSPVSGSNNTTVSAEITGLASNTVYHYRVKVVNCEGTPVYGTDQITNTLAVVTTTTVSGITEATASTGGTISVGGGASIIARGVCWSTSTNPTIANYTTTDGTGTGSFVSSLAGLESNTRFYIRAYATNNGGTCYGDEKSFSTLASIETYTVSSITTTTASGGGFINEGGGENITSRGVCWSTSEMPTITNSKTADGTGTGSFSSNISGLTSNTRYYIRAYAANSGGISYGEQKIFTTMPIVSTTDISSIAATSAASGGFITVGGGASIIAMGVCWSTNPNPTISDSKTTDSPPGTGSFTSHLTGLMPSTLYYVKAYATNDGGTAYGPTDLTFTTLCATPAATTSAATNIVDISALLNGTVNANGFSTTVTFEYGTTTSYGSTITATQSPVTGTTNIAVSAPALGLIKTTLYHYRVKAVNCGGTVYGDDKTFTTSLCPSTITITHTTGNVSPVPKTVQYGIVETNLSGTNKCWITSNLGADNQASSATDATEAAAGWYWQFNHKQGFKHDGSTLIPSASWIESIDEESDWIATNDPCNIILGTGWRIPTSTEWTNVDNNGGWNNYNDAYISSLKLHAAGYINPSLDARGLIGFYWVSVQSGGQFSWCLFLSSSQGLIAGQYKYNGFSIRCIRD